MKTELVSPEMRMDDEGRGARQRRKQADPTCCPVCGITIRPNEVEQHYTLEVDRLHKLSVSKSRKSLTLKEMPSAGNSPMPSSSSSADALASESKTSDAKECWTAYQRIKNNRNARLKVIQPALPLYFRFNVSFHSNSKRQGSGKLTTRRVRSATSACPTISMSTLISAFAGASRTRATTTTTTA